MKISGSKALKLMAINRRIEMYDQLIERLKRGRDKAFQEYAKEVRDMHNQVNLSLLKEDKK